MTDIRELNVAELDAVSGGDCASATLVASINTNTANLLAQMGNKQGAAYFYGVAKGNTQTGCPQ